MSAAGPRMHSQEWFAERAREASLDCARTAIAMPGMWPVYGEWHGAKQALAEAQARLAKAEKAWASFIAPALEDTDYRAIAQKKGLIP